MKSKNQLLQEVKNNLLFVLETQDPRSGVVREAVITAQECAYNAGIEAGKIEANKEVPVLLLQVAQLLEKRGSTDKAQVFRMAAEMLAVGLDDMTHLYQNNTIEQ